MKRVIFKIIFVIFFILLCESLLSQVSLNFHCAINGAQKVSKITEDKIICDVTENSNITISLSVTVVPSHIPVCITALQLPKELSIRFHPVCAYGTADSKCTVKIPTSSLKNQYKLLFKIYEQMYKFSKDITIILNIKKKTVSNIPFKTLPIPVMPLKPQYILPSPFKPGEEIPQPPLMYGPYTTKTDENGNFTLNIPILENTTLQGVIFNQDHQPIKNTNVKISIIPKSKNITNPQDIEKIIISLDDMKIEISNFRIVSSMDIMGHVERTIMLGKIILKEETEIPVDL